MKLTLVAAVAADGGIGRGNGLLFTDAEDHRHFRAVTMGKPVVMGRKTWLSLPERFRLLLAAATSCSAAKQASARPARDGASLEDVLARLAAEPEVASSGGADVYAQVHSPRRRQG
ncbi:MAG: dihydrofolate reductase [Rubrivivax sp.]